LAAISFAEDDPPAAKPATPSLSLRWTLSAHGACACGHGRRAWMARASSPPPPRGSPRGLGGGGAMFAPTPARYCAKLWLPFVGVLNALDRSLHWRGLSTMPKAQSRCHHLCWTTMWRNRAKHQLRSQPTVRDVPERWANQCCDDRRPHRAT